MMHTKEPWKIGNGRKSDLHMGWDTILGLHEDGEKFVIARGNANYEELCKVNIRRIIDCVNACIGMKDPKQEIDALRKEIVTPVMVQTNRLVDSLADVKRQSDEYKSILEDHGPNGHNCTNQQLVDIRAQRNELLSLVKELYADNNIYSNYPCDCELCKKTRAVITKFEAII